MTSPTITPLVFSRTCRLCLGEKDSLLNIFDLLEIDLATNIFNCVSINIDQDDNLPHTACFECVKYIIDWTKFHAMCHESDKVLRDMFGPSKVKEEAIDGEYSGVNINVAVKQEIEDDDDNLCVDIEQCDGDDGPGTINQIFNDIQNDHEYIYVNHDITLDDMDDEVDEKPDKNQIENGQMGKQKSFLKNNRYTRKKTEDEMLFSDEDDEEEDNVEKFLVRCEREDTIKAAINNCVYICEICSEIEDTMLEYLDHQETHEGQPVFKCDICPEVFSRKANLVLHEKNHPMPCPICGKMVKHLSTHQHIHTDKYKCLLCGHRASSRTKLNDHNYMVHKRLKEYVCEVCRKRFSSNRALELHRKVHKRTYSCKVCPFTTKNEAVLLKHKLYAEHPNEVHTCDICSIEFRSKFRLNEHKTYMHHVSKKMAVTFLQ